MDKESLRKVCNLVGVPADDMGVYPATDYVFLWHHPGLPNYLVGAVFMFCFGIWEVHDDEKETPKNPFAKSFVDVCPESAPEMIEAVTCEGDVRDADEFLERVLDWANERYWKGPV